VALVEFNTHFLDHKALVPLEANSGVDPFDGSDLRDDLDVDVSDTHGSFANDLAMVDFFISLALDLTSESAVGVGDVGSVVDVLDKSVRLFHVVLGIFDLLVEVPDSASVSFGEISVLGNGFLEELSVDSFLLHHEFSDCLDVVVLHLHPTGHFPSRNSLDLFQIGLVMNTGLFNIFVVLIDDLVVPVSVHLEQLGAVDSETAVDF